MLPQAIKHAILLAAMLRRGSQVRALERQKPERPFQQLPDWLVGMLLLTFGRSKQPAPARTAKYAQAEWNLRRAPADDDSQLWRVTITHWHDTVLASLLVLPAGSAITSSNYDPMGDRQFFLVKIPKGASITVLDPANVRIERVI